MSIGLCCHWLVENNVNTLNQQTLQLNRYKSGYYSIEKIQQVYMNNIQNVINHIPIISNFTNCFRLSSSLFPLADIVPHELWDNDNIKLMLKSAGDMFKEQNIRVTTHPGQFCVISSNTDSVIEKSIKELDLHAWIFDCMGFDESPYYAINIHGGVKNNNDKLVSIINSLSNNIKNRLTLENDEYSYNLLELADISSVTGIPIVFDSHHHVFNTGGLTLDEAYTLSLATWNNIKPLQHLSNSEPNNSNKRQHSQYVHYIPDCQLEALIYDTVDIDFEFKLKNIAINKFRKDWGL